ncbi:MAG: RIP metalloprotease RseP, partial [FCB group bacterium]|nr:RIP metalloprotease RseP [FCB group bacterium]
TLITIAAAIFTLGILILIHELGHFMVARMVGIRVERFSIGMPPRFLSIQNKVDGFWIKLFIPWFLHRIANATTIEFRIPRKNPVAGDTEYALSWTPFGGYVKMSGMIDESMDGEITGKPWEFTSKKRWQQLLTISGGVIMNTLLAFFLFSAIIYSSGMDEPVEGTFVGSLVSTEEREIFPAEEAGIMENDQIVMINGQSVTEWEELTGIVHAQPGRTISVEWLRNGIRYSDSIRVVKETIPTAEGTVDIGMIGIGRVTEHTDLGFVESVGYGARSTYMFGTLMARGFWSMITGATSMDQVGGPIMIAKMAGDMARRGWLDVFYFMAIISVNLAFINILPIPGLDGGHFLIISIEGIIRRPLPLNVKLIIQQVGMLFLLGLVLFITIQDISRL